MPSQPVPSQPAPSQPARRRRTRGSLRHHCRQTRRRSPLRRRSRAASAAQGDAGSPPRRNCPTHDPRRSSTRSRRRRVREPPPLRVRIAADTAVSAAVSASATAALPRASDAHPRCRRRRRRALRIVRRGRWKASPGSGSMTRSHSSVSLAISSGLVPMSALGQLRRERVPPRRAAAGSHGSDGTPMGARRRGAAPARGSRATPCGRRAARRRPRSCRCGCAARTAPRFEMYTCAVTPRPWWQQRAKHRVEGRGHGRRAPRGAARPRRGSSSDSIASASSTRSSARARSRRSSPPAPANLACGTESTSAKGAMHGACKSSAAGRELRRSAPGACACGRRSRVAADLIQDALHGRRGGGGGSGLGRDARHMERERATVLQPRVAAHGRRGWKGGRAGSGRCCGRQKATGNAITTVSRRAVWPLGGSRPARGARGSVRTLSGLVSVACLVSAHRPHSAKETVPRWPPTQRDITHRKNLDSDSPFTGQRSRRRQASWPQEQLGGASLSERATVAHSTPRTVLLHRRRPTGGPKRRRHGRHRRAPRSSPRQSS